MSKKCVVLTGGGTGGHVYPLLELARIMRDEFRLVYVGSGNKFEREAVKNLGLEYKAVLSGKVRRNISFLTFLQNIVDFMKFTLGTIRSFFTLLSIKPDIIFSKGGYVALPICLAGKMLGVKTVIHESDTLPGLSNRIVSRFARRILVGFPINAYIPAFASRAIHVGVPVRPDFFANSKEIGKSILFIGGSSGAQGLNELVYKITPKLLSRHKVIHVVGKENLKGALEFRESLNLSQKTKYEPIAYTDQMSKLIRDAGVVVSRSGATAIFEVMASARPLVLVPIPLGVTLHQFANARYLQKRGWAEVFDQTKDPEILISKIEKAFEKRNCGMPELLVRQSSQKIKRILVDEMDSELNLYQYIHLIGSGGISMRGIGTILKQLGKRITGSDLKVGGHSTENINKNLDLVVYSSAAGSTSAAKIEHEAARRLKIKTIKRSRAIALITQNKSVVSISGMHGKTTTASIAARIFESAGYRPSYLIGALPTFSNQTAKFVSDSEHFVLEACEYDGSFLDFESEAAIITNVEEEHLDYFTGGLEEIINKFAQFIGKIKPGGVLIYCNDDKNIKKVLGKADQTIIDKSIDLVSYGFDKSSDFVVKKPIFENGTSRFKISHDKEVREVISPIPGDHFALNCAACLALSSYFGIESRVAIDTIAGFIGASRRFDYVGETQTIKIYDDYGHHPTEITKTLQALKQMFPTNKCVVVFEPHQQKRFDDFYNEFYRVFAAAEIDRLIILPVFRIAGRDTQAQKNSQELVNQLKKAGKEAIFAQNYFEAVNFLIKNMPRGSVLLTLGATNVDRVGKLFLSEHRLEKKTSL